MRIYRVSEIPVNIEDFKWLSSRCLHICDIWQSEFQFISNLRMSKKNSIKSIEATFNINKKGI
jgi:hypothetical protein